MLATIHRRRCAKSILGFASFSAMRRLPTGAIGESSDSTLGVDALGSNWLAQRCWPWRCSRRKPQPFAQRPTTWPSLWRLPTSTSGRIALKSTWLLAHPLASTARRAWTRKSGFRSCNASRGLVGRASACARSALTVFACVCRHLRYHFHAPAADQAALLQSDVGRGHVQFGGE